MPYNTITDNYQLSSYIVDVNGTTPFVTIQSAINQAVADGLSNATIFIRPGTYIEDLTLAAGINLQGSQEEEVFVTGVHTPPLAGTILFQNIKFSSATDILNSAAAGTCNITIVRLIVH